MLFKVFQLGLTVLKVEDFLIRGRLSGAKYHDVFLAPSPVEQLFSNCKQNKIASINT